MAGLRWCPLCQRGQLKRHCAIANRDEPCGWERCDKCKTTYDPVNNRGVDRDGQRIKWPKHWPEGAAS